MSSIVNLTQYNEISNVLVQPYLERADEGDKRILLFEGDPVRTAARLL